MKMVRNLSLALGLLLVAVPALAQEIHIDYAHDFDFSQVNTFAYIETKETNPPNQLMGERIKEAIIKQLTAGGLKLVDTDIDLFVTYHLSAEENTVLNTTGFGYGGYGRGWGAYGGGATMSTTTAMTYTEGTLIVDAYEPGEKKMVWRGTGTVTVKDKPEKQTEQIQKVVEKMGAKWAKILAKEAKKKAKE